MEEGQNIVNSDVINSVVNDNFVNSDPVSNSNTNTNSNPGMNIEAESKEDNKDTYSGFKERYAQQLDLLKKEDTFNIFAINNGVRQDYKGQVSKVNMSIEPINMTEFDRRYNEIEFSFISNGWMDPYSAYFQIIIDNSTGSTPVQFDSSAHSLIKSMTISVNNKLVEHIEDYDLIHKLHFDFNLTRKERLVRRHWECFGTNEDGDNECRIQKDVDNNGDENEINYIKSNSKKTNGFEVRLPFMSKYFGSRIEEKNYKLIPLKMGIFKIKLKINDYPFFIPSTMDNVTARATLPDIKIQKPIFHFTQYEFEQGQDAANLNFYNANGMIYDYVDYDIIQKFYCEPKQLLQSIQVLRKNYTNIRALYSFVLDEVYKRNSYARPLGFHNNGFTIFRMREKGLAWPVDSYFKSSEIYNSSGEKNNKMLLGNILELQGTNLAKNNTILTPKNFALKWDYSHLFARMAFVKASTLSGSATKEQVTDFLNLFNENAKKKGIPKTCRTINQLRFETLPHNNGTYSGGINLVAGDELFLEWEQTNEAMDVMGWEFTDVSNKTGSSISLFDANKTSIPIYKVMYIVAESYKKAKLTLDGTLIVN